MTKITNPRYPGEGGSQTGPAGNASSTVESHPLASTEQTSEEILPILPKGFVENTAEVYAEVASYEILPPEKLREYWRVYTTTNRRLCDPTAKRLESFWWHVWGSKLRYSKGGALAKLYENISTGPTFVPLRGPANRYEGPPPTDQIFVQIQPSRDAEIKESSHQPSQVDLSSKSGAASSRDRDQTYDGVTKDRNGNASAVDTEVTQHNVHTTAGDEAQLQAPVKVLSSSASRPPPTQSILKKPRPSLSGSRPTARFTFPADMLAKGGLDDHTSTGTADTVGSSSFASGSESASSGLATEPSPSSAGSSRSGPRMPGGHKQTRAKQAKKKFMATSKRKAIVLKRPGSQVLSATSEGSGQQETRRLQPSACHPGEHFLPEEDTERVATPPANPELSTQNLTTEDEHVRLQPLQPHQPHRQEVSSPSMSDTITTDRQAAQQHVPLSDNSPSARSATARLEYIRSTDVPTTDVAPLSTSSTRSGRRGPASVAPPMVRGYSSTSMDITVGSREILGHPSPRLLRHMTLPQQIRPTAAPTSAARSSPNPSSSLESAEGKSSRPSTPGGRSFVAPMLLRSTSQDGSSFWSRRGSETVSSPSAALATPSMVAARGVFSDADGPDPLRMYASTGLSDPIDDDDDDQQEPSFHLGRSSFSYTDPNPLHRPMFTPTRPSPTPRIPFARTRSQLNVILDREKARLGEGTFTSWQESRSGRDTPQAAEGSDTSRVSVGSEIQRPGNDERAGSTVL